MRLLCNIRSGLIIIIIIKIIIIIMTMTIIIIIMIIIFFSNERLNICEILFLTSLPYT